MQSFNDDICQHLKTTNAWRKNINYSVKVESIQQLASWNIGLKNNVILNLFELCEHFNI